MLTAMRSSIAALLLALVACAPVNKQPQTAANAQGSGDGSGSGVVCHEVTDTGTIMSHTECTPIDEKQEQTDDAQRWIKRPRSSPTGAH